MLVLVLGNLHIPNRASELPAVFRKLLVPGKIDHILCTGNLCHHDTRQYLYSLVENTDNVHIIKGEYDAEISGIEVERIKIGDFTFALLPNKIPYCDETLSLSMRLVPSDVYISSKEISGGPILKTLKHQGVSYGSGANINCLYVNPGSASGAAPISDRQQTNPSFVLIDVAPAKSDSKNPSAASGDGGVKSIVCYSYSHVIGSKEDDVQVEKKEFVLS